MDGTDRWIQLSRSLQQLQADLGRQEDRDRNRLNIRIGQARLINNYGSTSMGPYVRLRVGHCVFETDADTNGDTNPQWHTTFQTLPQNRVNQIHVEIYDRCVSKRDELIAWATIPVPIQIYKGVTTEEWYNLTGTQGPIKEGTINIIMSFGVYHVRYLPGDFLQQEPADQQAAMALQQALSRVHGDRDSIRLNITIVQARLIRSYGLTKMDPYARLRVGHCVYETEMDPKGDTTPKWHKTFQTLPREGVNQMHIEIIDQCSIMMDGLIAWTTIPIPIKVYKGVTIEKPYKLTGRQGPDKEGTINIIISFGASV